MSRVGKAPIVIPEGVNVSVDGNVIEVAGPKGKLGRELHASIRVRVADNRILVERLGNSREERSLHGLCRSLVANMVKGVSEGYEKTIEIRGIGFRAQVQGSKLVLNLGYSHGIDLEVPEGITVQVVKKAMVEQLAVSQIVFTGVDKDEIGKFAATIRGMRPPEPYKGKGIRNVGEYVRRKAGKKAA